jgi:hypothetical protein
MLSSLENGDRPGDDSSSKNSVMIICIIINQNGMSNTRCDLGWLNRLFVGSAASVSGNLISQDYDKIRHRNSSCYMVET